MKKLKTDTTNHTYALTFSQDESGHFGWICPRCGAVHSPNSKTCSCEPKTETKTWEWKPISRWTNLPGVKAKSQY